MTYSRADEWLEFAFLGAGQCVAFEVTFEGSALFALCENWEAAESGSRMVLIVVENNKGQMEL